jgi:hypothetical protein
VHRHEPTQLCAHRGAGGNGKSRGRGGVTTTLRLYRYHGAFVRCACGLCGVPSPLRLRPTHMIILLRHSAFSIRMEDYHSCHILLNAQWKRCTPPQRSHETDEKAFFPGAFPAATLLQRGRSSTRGRGRGRGSPTRDFPSTHGRQDDRSSCCPAPTSPRAFDLRNHHPSRCRICSSRGTVGAGPCKGLSWLRCSCRLPRQASTNPS